MKKGFPALSDTVLAELGFLDLILEQLRSTRWEHTTAMSLFSSDLRFPLLKTEVNHFFRWDKLPLLSGSKQNSHLPEKMITDTVDKYTWSTYETQPVHQTLPKLGGNVQMGIYHS